MAGAMVMPSLGVRMYDLTDQHIEAALTNLIAGLESEYKFEVNPVLIKVILGVAMSVDEVQDCVSQLISCKGYFGRGGCCGKDRLRAFSSCCIESEALETVECLIKSTMNELSEPVDRDPVIFVLEEPAAATATTTMTLPLPRYRHVASPPPPVHAGVAGLGDEQQLEQLARVLSSLGTNEMAFAAPLLANSALLAVWTGSITVFAAPDVFLRSSCTMSSTNDGCSPARDELNDDATARDEGLEDDVVLLASGVCDLVKAYDVHLLVSPSGGRTVLSRLPQHEVYAQLYRGSGFLGDLASKATSCCSPVLDLTVRRQNIGC
ncbi:hypothetical protein OsJ_12076 [Oryza sativa Japonica Group]|uniref:Uncharacterized protein n=1 Tax=Oryza sativa subsp. japonica TaxID=39947 RepID=B9FA94_ORYSJ|nr:hypothetical protein OsJ_12076 [Oryza sativa Japonica Group]